MLDLELSSDPGLNNLETLEDNAPNVYAIADNMHLQSEQLLRVVPQ
jgi:hypothetical protein